MPNPSDYDNEKDFMGACVPMVMDEGEKDQDAAVGKCMGMWRNKKAFFGMSWGEAIKHFSEHLDNNCLKAIAESPYELVVQNKIIVFGGNDATGYAYGPNEDGSRGERFTKATDLESEYTATGRLYVDFEHGRDPDEIGNHEHNILGFVDWKTATVTDEGVIVKRVLNRRHKYMKWLEPLIRAGLVGNSSEAISGQTQKSIDGTIQRWPLKRDTLTVTPLEPRMMDQNIIEAVKAMAAEFPQYKSLLTAPEDTALSDAGDKNSDPIKQPKREKDMEEQEIKSVVATAVAEALSKRDAEIKAETEKQAALKVAEEAGYKKALEDVKEHRAPAFNTQPLGFSEEKDAVPAFKHWMQTGQINGGLIRPTSDFMKSHGEHFLGNSEEKAAWNVTTGESGAFLVPDPLYNQIVAKRNNASWVRQFPCQYFTTPADHLLVPREATSLTDFVLTAEGGSYDEEEGTVGQKDLIQYKFTKLTKVNEEFLMYNSTNWESWFASALGRAVAGTENTIYTSGNGTSMPEGIVTGATVANTTATTDIILPAEFMTFLGYLGNAYNVRGETGLMMSNVTKYYLLGYTGNPFLYQQTPPRNDALTEDLIQGYRVVVNDKLDPYTTASAKCIIFGNYNFYGVIEKPGMVVQRNPYLYMATGQVGIFASIFRGGGVLQSEAFYYLTNHS